MVHSRSDLRLGWRQYRWKPIADLSVHDGYLVAEYSWLVPDIESKLERFDYSGRKVKTFVSDKFYTNHEGQYSYHSSPVHKSFHGSLLGILTSFDLIWTATHHYSLQFHVTTLLSNNYSEGAKERKRKSFRITPWAHYMIIASLSRDNWVCGQNCSTPSARNDSHSFSLSHS